MKVQKFEKFPIKSKSRGFSCRKIWFLVGFHAKYRDILLKYCIFVVDLLFFTYCSSDFAIDSTVVISSMKVDTINHIWQLTKTWIISF